MIPINFMTAGLVAGPFNKDYTSIKVNTLRVMQGLSPLPIPRDNSTKISRKLSFSAIKRMLVISAASAMIAAGTTGCASILGILGSAIKPGGIDANVQVGKENTKIDTNQIVAKQETESVVVTGNTGETVVVKGAVAAKKVSKASAPTSKSVVSGDTSSIASDLVGQVKTSKTFQEVSTGDGSSVVVNQNNQYPTWLLLLLVLGWLLPTPTDMFMWIASKFRKVPEGYPERWTRNGKEVYTYA